MPREVIMGSWRSLFYAQHHQQSLEIGTSIAGCQSLHKVGSTHLLMADIYNYKHSQEIDVTHISCGCIVLTLINDINNVCRQSLAKLIFLFFKVNMKIFGLLDGAALGLFLNNLTMSLLLVGLTSCCC